MDSHDRHDRLLTAFLAGDLDPADARRWDEHLLECERCWRAGLEDRAAFAVEVAAAARTGAQRQSRPSARSRQPGRHSRRLYWRLAGAGLLAAGAAVTLLMVLLPGGHQVGSVPAAVAAVARYAQAIPSPARDQPPYFGGRAAPVEVGR